MPFPSQRWWCLTPNATGDMRLWGEVSGPALTVTPVMGWLRPHAGKAARVSDPVMRERMGATTLVSASEDLDDDDTGVLVADWAIDNLAARQDNQPPPHARAPPENTDATEASRDNPPPTTTYPLPLCC
ncbi:hypothetical protein [Actinomyces wuliandei]|uniref:hypothetical protein n=1 Tax=Actinomyces wuliandei TaxID=2057743 RepID=UPI000FD98DFD|nr:hypothetical protein [Actinomyces wuliandei]